MWHNKLNFIYLRDFEELWDSGHSCQESFIDFQCVFALSFLHLEEFLYKYWENIFQNVWERAKSALLDLQKLNQI